MKKAAWVVGMVIVAANLAALWGAEAPTGNLDAFDHVPPATVPPSDPSGRLVGIAYTTWHKNNHWDPAHEWGTPQLGYYASNDPAIIRQHAKWLADAGVDFVWEDWSNDLKYRYDPDHPNPTFDMIEGSTVALFDEFIKMRAEGQATPNISIFIGTTGSEKTAIPSGALQSKADQVWNEFVANPKYKPLLQTYLGKPLLVVYMNTPTPYQDAPPPWDDLRFTVRWMTGYITQQHKLMTPDLVSKLGYWSWEDRGPQTYPVYDGHPEAMTIVATWRNDREAPTPGRHNGDTFRREWERARQIGPTFALVVSWNEWSKGEQPSPEISKDIEPSKEFGTQYLDIMKEEIALFKAGK